MIHYGFHVLCFFPHGQLAVRAGAFVDNSFDVRHFFFAAEFFHLGSDKIE